MPSSGLTLRSSPAGPGRMGAWNLDSEKKKHKAIVRQVVIIIQYAITGPIVRTGVCKLQMTIRESTKWIYT